MRVHIAYIQNVVLRDYEKAYVPQVMEELRQHGTEAGYVVEADPARADLVVLWERFEYKRPDYISVLENEPLIRQHAQRAFTINYDDHPEGFLAGIYTSLEAPFFDSARHRNRPFFLANNQDIYQITREQVLAQKPGLLFSFLGAASHPVRVRLFERFATPTREHHVERIYKWYNHNGEDRTRFIKVALDSAFCLCPRGYTAHTFRIAEVMALGRAPVIIADDWIPFSFEDKLPYCIQVPEREIANLPEILRARRSEAEELGHNARTLWEKNLSPSRRVVALMDIIAGLARETGGRFTYEYYRELWHSRNFLKNLGWTVPQRAALRIEQHARRWFPSIKIPGVSPLMRYRNVRHADAQ